MKALVALEPLGFEFLWVSVSAIVNHTTEFLAFAVLEIRASISFVVLLEFYLNIREFLALALLLISATAVLLLTTVL